MALFKSDVIRVCLGTNVNDDARRKNVADAIQEWFSVHPHLVTVPQIASVVTRLNFSYSSSNHHQPSELMFVIVYQDGDEARD